MNKKGFTLIELLAALIIMGLILVIVIPNISDIIDDNSTKIYKNQINNIIKSTKEWGADNIGKLPSNNGDSIRVTLGELQTGGYVKKDLKNPLVDKPFDLNKTYVVITNNNGILNYEVFVEQEWYNEFKNWKN